MKKLLAIILVAITSTACFTATKNLHYRPYDFAKGSSYGYLDVPLNSTKYTISYEAKNPQAPDAFRKKFAMIRAAEIGASISMPYFHFVAAPVDTVGLDKYQIAEANMDSLTQESRERISNPNREVKKKIFNHVEITVEYRTSPCGDCFSVLSILSDARREGYLAN